MCCSLSKTSTLKANRHDLSMVLQDVSRVPSDSTFSQTYCPQVQKDALGQVHRQATRVWTDIASERTVGNEVAVEFKFTFMWSRAAETWAEMSASISAIRVPMWAVMTRSNNQPTHLSDPIVLVSLQVFLKVRARVLYFKDDKPNTSICVWHGKKYSHHHYS